MMGCRYLLVCGILLLVEPGLAQGQRTGFGRFVDRGFHDPIRLVQGLDARFVAGTAGAVGLVMATSLFDRRLEQSLSLPASGVGRAFLDVGNFMGGPYVVPPAVGLWGLTLLTDNRRLQNAAFTSVQALGMAGITAIGIKYVTGRHRPNTGEGPWVFSPGSGNTSFPSGHATAVAALLTPWALYYPHPISWGLAGVAISGTALSRIARDKHWASDTVAGILLGGAMGVGLARLHLHETRGRTSFTVVPLGRQFYVVTRL